VSVVKAKIKLAEPNGLAGLTAEYQGLCGELRQAEEARSRLAGQIALAAEKVTKLKAQVAAKKAELVALIDTEAGVTGNDLAEGLTGEGVSRYGLPSQPSEPEAPREVTATNLTATVRNAAIEDDGLDQAGPAALPDEPLDLGSELDWEYGEPRRTADDKVIDTMRHVGCGGLILLEKGQMLCTKCRAMGEWTG
jgi:hypothetical protein